MAEKIQDLRNRVLVDAFLFESGRRLACCRVELRDPDRVVDLCDPGVLVERGVAPDRLASRRRTVTRPIAGRLHDDRKVAGFRWWSAFSGDWHTVVLFSDRVRDDALRFSEPEPLRLDAPPLLRAAEALGIEVEGD